MKPETKKRIYDISMQVFFGEQYANVAREFAESAEELQRNGRTFTKAQWAAFERYRDALMALHEVMMQIALEESPESEN